jgi:transposase-like protein
MVYWTLQGVFFMPRTRRSFPADFKAKLVIELLTGAASQAELCRKHNLGPQLLGHWKAVVLERLHTLFQEDPQAGQDQVRIAELEQLVGRQAYELEILKKASRMLAGPAPSNGRSS